MKITVPDTSGNMNAPACVMGASGGIAAYVSMIGRLDDDNFGMRFDVAPITPPTAQEVVDNGFPLLQGMPVSMQPVQLDGVPVAAIDPAAVFFARASSGTGDVRIIW